MKTSMIAIVAMLSLGGAATAQTAATPEPTPVPEPNLDMTVEPGAAETPATGTDAPATDAPATGMDALATGTDTPATGMDAPATGMDAPATGMDTPATGMDAPADGTPAPATGMDTAATNMADMEELDDSVMVTDWNMSVDDIEDMDVYDSEGTKIGEVENVLGRNETAEALVVDFDDDAGYTGEDRIVPLDMLTVSGDRLELSADADVATFEEYND